VVNGFSKAFAMTGWRLEIAIRLQLVVEKMALLLQTIVSCVPPFVQRAGIAAITGDHAEVNAMKDEYFHRIQVLVTGLNRLDGISWVEPEGAIYAFPDIRGTGMTSEQFADLALDDVLTLDGPVICEIMCIRDQEIVPAIASLRKDDGTMVSKKARRHVSVARPGRLPPRNDRGTCAWERLTAGHMSRA
jgi:hypothetical protein